MEGRTWLYSGLIVVVLALMGFGIWFVMNPSDKIEVPEEDPIVLMDINNPANETVSQLSLYEDGTVIYVEDSYTEIPIPDGDDYTRTWRTGMINETELDDFLSYLNSIDFNEMDTTFIAGEDTDEMDSDETMYDHIVPGGTTDYVRISVDNGTIENTVVAIGYIGSGNDPYSELPYPVDFIYGELAYFIEKNTDEVQVEELTY